MSDTPSPNRPRTAADLLPQPLQRYATLVTAGVIGIALFGFLTGIREPARASRPTPTPVDRGSVPAAVEYSQLPTATLRPNAGWKQHISQLRSDTPEIFAPVVRTEEMKMSALADRAKNRAYDGAPPPIPHPTQGQTLASCVACHEEGLRVGDRIATKMSHALLTNCTQCHVEQSGTAVENGFIGLYRAGPGDRANPGAPPTIPHHTWLRENCNSCHGLLTRPGTRTTHPWLTNCTQCHVSSAALDQVDFTGGRK
jgi:cytochrome c-type protein NapB